MTSIPVRGTTLHIEEHGDGPPLLLIHGAGEDVTMLAAQAKELAASGYRVISYSRRGTGSSGREDWPGSGADQHADDAAALLTALDATPATVLGLSSGGVVALAIAARHPDVVARVLAWEPPVLGVLDNGAAIDAEFTAPSNRHLAEHPGDYVGAQAILLSAILGFPVATDDPAFAASRANAESMIRDDPNIMLRRFGQDELSGVDVTVAIGTGPLDFIHAAAERIAAWTGHAPLVVDAHHHVYFADPAVLADVLRR